MPTTTALVILRPATRRSLVEMPPISRQNLDQAVVSPKDRAAVEAYFAERGFEVSDAGPIAFSIVGADELFAATLGSVDTQLEGTLRYATHTLPDEIRECVEAVESERHESFLPLD